MAKSAATGFFLRGSLYGNIEPAAAVAFLIDDSATVKAGDSITLDSDGNARRSAVGEAVLGIAVALTDLNGLNVFTPQAAGLTGSTLTEDDQIAVSSTNTTDATRNVKVLVQLDPAGCLLWYNDSSGTLARTNLLNLFDVVSGGNQVDQSTASETSGQYQLIKIDPDGDGDASKGLFRIAEPQLLGHVGNSTDIIPA